MEILEFVKSEQVDPIYLRRPYYLAPDEAGEKPYALLFEALKNTGRVGGERWPCTTANTS